MPSFIRRLFAAIAADATIRIATNAIAGALCAIFDFRIFMNKDSTGVSRSWAQYFRPESGLLCSDHFATHRFTSTQLEEAGENSSNRLERTCISWSAFESV